MDLKIPEILASRQDITHVHRELRIFADMVDQSIMRHDDPIKYPPISDTLRSLAIDNQVDLRDPRACDKLLLQLEELKQGCPTVHISFPADPTRDVLQKLVVWFRKEINPQVFIQIGLQPTIAAGIVLRTPNKVFDFSLRQHLYKNRDKLIEVLKQDEISL
jgi:F0F1-type ATP synthase delta subunit